MYFHGRHSTTCYLTKICCIKMLGFIKINHWLAVLAIFCPFLVLTSAFKFFPLGDDGGDLTMYQKIYVFYRAPLVKYIGTFISYAVFLLLYTRFNCWVTF